MLNPFKFIFTVILRWAFNLNLDSSPEWTALVGTWILLNINLLTVYSYFAYHSKWSNIFFNTVDGRVSFVLALLSFSYIYWGFIYKNKYKWVMKSKTYKESNLWHSIIVWIYIIGSNYLLSLTRNPAAIK